MWPVRLQRIISARWAQLSSAKCGTGTAARFGVVLGGQDRVKLSARRVCLELAIGEAMETPTLGLHSIEEYRPLVGDETVDRILAKASVLEDLHIVNISSTQYGGGVAEILSPLTLLMNAMGIEMGWRVMEGRPEFFAFTKELHNGLQGAPVEITESKRRAYEQISFENSLRMHLEHEVVVVHDPQPLALAQFYQRIG